VVQSAFALLCIVLGIRFVQFVRAAGTGQLPLPERPPGVEAFLPISGLMGLLDWAYQGTLNAIHPAATVLVVLVILLAIVARKSFCSWICPVGFLSEILARFGRWSVGRNFRLWRGVDVPLRSLKYLLLAFFGVSIVIMSPEALRDFIESPYNRVSDVKMGLFFTDLGRTGAIVIGSLLVASVFVKGAWCRYLCPYGALLGLVSWASPSRVKRDPVTCVDCGLCDKACMARLPVSSVAQVGNVECVGCFDCIAACPVEDALVIDAAGRRVSPMLYAAVVVGLFVGGYAGARAAGIWENAIADGEYIERIQEIDGPEYGHPGR